MILVIPSGFETEVTFVLGHNISISFDFLYCTNCSYFPNSSIGFKPIVFNQLYKILLPPYVFFSIIE